MTAEDFRAWLERRGLNQTTAAPHLCAHRLEVWRWANGKRSVPPRVARIVELMDGVERPDTAEMRNIRAWWASLTWEQRQACLGRNDPQFCPCGDGTIRGHPYAWCMPHPAWLPRKSEGGG